MNKHEVRGSISYYKGKIEKAAGDMFDRRDWQLGGVIDQAAGAGEHVYGRAGALAREVRTAAPPIAETGREQATKIARRLTGHAAALARQGGERAQTALAQQPLLCSAMAVVAGYALARAVHGRRG